MDLHHGVLPSLLFLLLIEGSKPLFVEVDLLSGDVLPSGNAKVCKELENVGQELVRPADDNTPATANGLIHRLAYQHYLQNYEQYDAKPYCKEESWEHNRQSTRVEPPSGPLGRIIPPERRHQIVQLLDRLSEVSRLIPGPFDENEAKASVDQEQDHLPASPCPTVIVTLCFGFLRQESRLKQSLIWSLLH